MFQRRPSRSSTSSPAPAATSSGPSDGGDAAGSSGASAASGNSGMLWRRRASLDSGRPQATVSAPSKQDPATSPRGSSSFNIRNAVAALGVRMRRTKSATGSSSSSSSSEPSSGDKKTKRRSIPGLTTLLSNRPVPMIPMPTADNAADSNVDGGPATDAPTVQQELTLAGATFHLAGAEDDETEITDAQPLPSSQITEDVAMDTALQPVEPLHDDDFQGATVATAAEVSEAALGLDHTPQVHIMDPVVELPVEEAEAEDSDAVEGEQAPIPLNLPFPIVSVDNNALSASVLRGDRDLPPQASPYAIVESVVLNAKHSVGAVDETDGDARAILGSLAMSSDAVPAVTTVSSTQPMRTASAEPRISSLGSSLFDTGDTDESSSSLVDSEIDFIDQDDLGFLREESARQPPAIDRADAGTISSVSLSSRSESERQRLLPSFYRPKTKMPADVTSESKGNRSARPLMPSRRVNPDAPIRQNLSTDSARLADAFSGQVNVPESIIQCILWFDVLPPIAKLKAELLTGLVHKFETFRSRLVIVGGDSQQQRRRQEKQQPQWEVIDMFNVHPHVVQVDQKDLASIERFISSLTAIQFDRGSALWRVHVVRNLSASTSVGGGEEGRSCIVLSVHRAVADGSALIAAVSSLLTDNTNDAITAPQDPIGAPLFGDLVPPTSSSSPATTTSMIASLASWAVDLAAGYARALVLSMAPADTLVRALHGGKTRDESLTSGGASSTTVVLCPAIPYSKLTRIAESLSIRVADVVTSAIAGAFRRYLAECDAATTATATATGWEDARMRALLAVGIPASSSARGLERDVEGDGGDELNDGRYGRLSGVSVPLLVKISDASTRARATSQRTPATTSLMRTALASANLRRLIELVAGARFAESFVERVVGGHTCVVASANGPEVESYLARARVTGMQVVVVPSKTARNRQVVSLLVYDRMAHVAFCVRDGGDDGDVVRDLVGRLRVHLLDEIEVLASQCGLLLSSS